MVVINGARRSQTGRAGFEDRPIDIGARYALGRYALGIDRHSGLPYLSISVATSMVDYQEYYRLDGAEYATFLTDAPAASAFAETCRLGQREDRLILPLGTDRGSSR